jgi:hypothetical protein
MMSRPPSLYTPPARSETATTLPPASCKHCAVQRPTLPKPCGARGHGGVRRGSRAAGGLGGGRRHPAGRAAMQLAPRWPLLRAAAWGPSRASAARWNQQLLVALAKKPGWERDRLLWRMPTAFSSAPSSSAALAPAPLAPEGLHAAPLAPPPAPAPHLTTCTRTTPHHTSTRTTPHLHHERALGNAGGKVAAQELARGEQHAPPRGVVAAVAAMQVQRLACGRAGQGRAGQGRAS